MTKSWQIFSSNMIPHHNCNYFLFLFVVCLFLALRSFLSFWGFFLHVFIRKKRAVGRICNAPPSSDLTVHISIDRFSDVVIICLHMISAISALRNPARTGKLKYDRRRNHMNAGAVL